MNSLRLLSHCAIASFNNIIHLAAFLFRMDFVKLLLDNWKRAFAVGEKCLADFIKALQILIFFIAKQETVGVN